MPGGKPNFAGLWEQAGHQLGGNAELSNFGQNCRRRAMKRFPRI